MDPGGRKEIQRREGRGGEEEREGREEGAGRKKGKEGVDGSLRELMVPARLATS